MPRASLAQFEDLRKAIIATNWAEKLKAEVRFSPVNLSPAKSAKPPSSQAMLCVKMRISQLCGSQSYQRKNGQDDG